MIYTDESYIRKVLIRRREDAHKGDFGKVLLYAGSPGMAGAAILNARAALKSGAGLVQFLLPELTSPMLPILQTAVPEATCIPMMPANVSQQPAVFTPPDPSNDPCVPMGSQRSPFPANTQIGHTSSTDSSTEAWTINLNSYAAISAGSGLGKSPDAAAALSRILEGYTGTLVLDADALNLVAASEELADKVRTSKARIILTPHVGEAKRLLHTCEGIAGLEARKHAVCILAEKYHCIAILKGSGTLVAQKANNSSPADDAALIQTFSIYQNTTGNPGMATAGSGDTLAGLIASLAAQGYAPLDAARIGVFIHGYAGDLAAQELGEMGVTASDIVHNIPYALKEYY